jgi:hypothetical protein
MQTKKQEVKPMQKRYRITIDYNFDINEKVSADGDEEVNSKLIEHAQHILNALFLRPDILLKFLKNRLYWGNLDCDPWGNDMGDMLGIEKSVSEKYMLSLSQYIPAETKPYFFELFSEETRNHDIVKDVDILRGLIIIQFKGPTPVNASIEEIEIDNHKETQKDQICSSLANGKLAQCFI